MKIPNEIHPIEQVFINESFSYYNGLKHVIKQADLINKEIFSKNDKPYNGIFSLLSHISKKTVFCNINLIDFSNTDDYEIQRQIQDGIYSESRAESNHKIIDLIYEHEQFTSVLEKQFIKWWEEDIKERVTQKYNGIRNANSVCQFARQIRNAFGHSQINITVSNCDDPIWNGLNLKDNNGKNIYEIMSIADFINFWIEFEQLEL